MTKIIEIRNSHNEALEKLSIEQDINHASLQRLLDAEKTKKLLKRNALIQQNIDREIDNALGHENR